MVELKENECIHKRPLSTCFICRRNRKKEIQEFEIKKILHEITNLPIDFIDNIYKKSNYTLELAVNRASKKRDCKTENIVGLKKLSRKIQNLKSYNDRDRLLEGLKPILRQINKRRKKLSQRDIPLSDNNKYQRNFDKIRSDFVKHKSNKKIQYAIKNISINQKEILKYILNKWSDINSVRKKFGLSPTKIYKIDVNIDKLNFFGLKEIHFDSSKLNPNQIAIKLLMNHGIIFRGYLDSKGKLFIDNQFHECFGDEIKTLFNLAIVSYYCDLVISKKVIENDLQKNYLKDSKHHYNSDKKSISMPKYKNIPRKDYVKKYNTNDSKNTLNDKRISYVDPFRRRLPEGQKPSFTKIVEADKYGIDLQGPGYPKSQYTFVLPHKRGQSDSEIDYYYKYDNVSIKSFELILNLIGL